MADDRQFDEALNRVDLWCARNPGWTRHGVEQPGQGSTNRVVLVRRGEDVRVCKVFCERERMERETFALRHWGPTGLVPKLFEQVGERMIVVSFLPGHYLLDGRISCDDSHWLGNCRAVGEAMAQLAAVPIGDVKRQSFEFRFYQDLPTLRSYLKRIITLGRSIHARDADFGGGFWQNSLDFAESQLPAILDEPPVLYHQDVTNLHVRDGEFVGFFDLEMCRVGCASMQLGSALAFVEREASVWTPMREGWERATSHWLSESELHRAAGVHHLLCWRVISRYLSYDGTGRGYDWSSPADPKRYRESIERVYAALGIVK